MRVTVVNILTCLAIGWPSLILADTSERQLRVKLGSVNEARLSSQMEGRITSLPRRLGDSFRKGDLLVAFDCDQHRAAREAASAQVMQSERTLAARESLAKLKAVPEIEVEQARTDLIKARAELARYQAILNDCRVLAPFDGTIVRVHVNQWETVGRGTVLMHIVDPAKLEIEAVVPSQWLRWLKVGTRFRVAVDEASRDVEAEIQAIAQRIDPVSQSVPVKAVILGDTKNLLPGMSGFAYFEPENVNQD
jgi:membrane fusion protein, multidrug efflux system